MLVALLPMQVLADNDNSGGTVQTLTLHGGKVLALQNDFLRVSLYNDGAQGAIATVPSALADKFENNFPDDYQIPYCGFYVYNQGKKESRFTALSLKNAEFVDTTPYGTNKAIKADYDIIVYLSYTGSEFVTLHGTATAYYELAKVTDNPTEKASSWGVLTSIGKVNFDDNEALMQFGDFELEWSYAMYCFTGMGHYDAVYQPNGPAIKTTTVTIEDYEDKNGNRVYNETSSNKVITSRTEDLSTWHLPKGYSTPDDRKEAYITKAYTDGYPWANPFAALSQYYTEKDLIYTAQNNKVSAELPRSVSISPRDYPYLTRMIITNRLFAFHDDYTNFLWGFDDLAAFDEELPTKPDEVSASISSNKLAVFKTSSGVTVEHYTDNAALDALKKKYNTSPIAQISGDYESTNGSEFVFTNGSAMLSPTVTATWNKNSGGKLIIKRDGTIEQNGINLNAPSFKFYQPKSGTENSLNLGFDDNGLVFEFEPQNNEALIYVDIPYSTSKIDKATADTKGNLILSGEIGFKTIFDGAEFTLNKLGYGLKEKTLPDGKKAYDFKVNGVDCKGSFDTADLLTLELAAVEGEVNTFEGEERYAFSLELNAFDLFETEASLALERSNKGTLLPDELWFYVKASPGIVLVPPVPVGQLNGGGAGFKDLVATVNGNYFAIPPLKLRGALTGTYMHIIEGTGNVVIGPSEISLKATDINIVGAGANTQIIDEFGYALKLDGQERNYKGETYTGIYFAGAQNLSLKLPSQTINVIEVESELELGAFGGANDRKDKVYLGIGANATATGTIKIPDSSKIWGGKKLRDAKINLIAGGQTTFPIRNTTVSNGIKEAFRNIDPYLGAMGETKGRIFDARAWALIPHIIRTKFKIGKGWGFEVKLHNMLPHWDWTEKGVTPVVQSAQVSPALLSLANAPETSAEITITAGADETPYILLSFDNSVTEEQVKSALQIDGCTIGWADDDGIINPDDDISAATDLMTNNKDGKEYRNVILRLKNGGTYQINAGELTFKHEEATVTPFERLNLTQNNNNLSGKIDYAENGTKYVLRTYLANAEGEADYLIDEQELTGADSINVEIPTSGGLVPTGNYFVTSFLMTEKDTEVEGKIETALMAIDSKSFTDKVSYKNTNEPSAPQNVSLEAIGNEAMRAAWDKCADADGYSVRIYKDENGTVTDTGFGYDLDKDQTSIDMAVTSGGNGVEISENGNNVTAGSVPAEKLLPDTNYRVGVRAYRSIDGGKYYSAESESLSKYLPKYESIDITIKVNENICEADKNGVHNAYIGNGTSILTLESSKSGTAFKVTRMDNNSEILPENGEYPIPSFEGTLMFKIDGIVGKDVTSEYLLISTDKEPPVLTLSSDIFYADKDTGEYKITGVADAGSKIIYNDADSVYAGANGVFEISGILNDGESSDSVLLQAEDMVQNTSEYVFAFISKRMTYNVTVNDSYAQVSGSGEYAEKETVTVNAGTRDGYVFTGWSSESGITFKDDKAEETTFEMPDKDVTITANWRKISTGGSGGSLGAPVYTVKFDTNGGSEITDKKVSGNIAIKEPAKPEKNGFVFAGWYSDKELSVKFDFNTHITKNTTLYAKWDKADSSADKLILTIDKLEAKVFGKTVANDVAPIITNDRTMLPARFVAENLGAVVSWDEADRIVTIKGKNLKTGEDVTIIITIDKATATVNGGEINLDSPAFIRNDRTYTPVRFIAEQLGADVNWDENERNVIITLPDKAEN